MHQIHPFKPWELTATDLDTREIDLAELLTRRRFIIGAGGLLGVAALGSCGADDEAMAPTATTATCVFSHALGETEVPAKPERIIALSALELMWPLFQVGVEPVGVDIRSGTLEQLRTIDPALADRAGALPPIGGNDALNLEAIAALNPDLIIGMSWQAESYDDLSQIAPTVMLDGATDIVAWQRELAALAGVADNDMLEERIAEYDARVATLREQYLDMWPNLEWTRLADFYAGNFYVLDTFPGDPAFKVFADLGAQQSSTVAQFTGQELPAISLELIPEYDADVIFITAYPEAINPQMLTLLEPTFASQSNQIIEVQHARWAWRNVETLLLILDDLEVMLADGVWDVSGDF